MPTNSSRSSVIGEDRIREAFEYAATGMAIADLDGRFEQSNPAYREILARSEDELQRETILSVTHEEDRDECRIALTKLVGGEIPSFVLEKRYVRPSGVAIWVRNSFSLLKEKDGRGTHIISVCNDISERREAEQRLLQSEKLALVGQLTSSIAHEINNPLEAVMNLLFIAREAESLDFARKYVAEAEVEVRRIAEIANQTLRFRKEQAAAGIAEIADLIDSVLVLFHGKLTESRVDLTVERRGSTELICYPGEIRQVLANLVKNAIDAMPGGGRLRIRSRAATDCRTGVRGVRITVADTGHGISPETLRRIYEPFFSTKGEHGTGLGLWITSGILTKHRGHMHVRSSDLPGRSWTVFSLVFPYQGADGKPAGLQPVR